MRKLPVIIFTAAIATTVVVFASDAEHMESSGITNDYIIDKLLNALAIFALGAWAWTYKMLHRLEDSAAGKHKHLKGEIEKQREGFYKELKEQRENFYKELKEQGNALEKETKDQQASINKLESARELQLQTNSNYEKDIEEINKHLDSIDGQLKSINDLKPILENIADKLK